MICGLEDVNAICNEEKTVPVAWITPDGHDVTEDFIHYARPLIQGNIERSTRRRWTAGICIPKIILIQNI